MKKNKTIQIEELLLQTGLTWTSLMSKVKACSFPAPVYFGDNTICWLRAEVNEWEEDIDELPENNGYYVVWVGNVPGVHTDWNFVKKTIFYNLRPEFKRFDTLEEAEQAFINGHAMYRKF